MPRAITFLHLPIKVRRLVYEYAGITEQTRDLNFGNIDIYCKDEYPEQDNVESVLCFHNNGLKINRREDYRTLEPYWETDFDPTAIVPEPPRGVLCERHDCGGGDNIPPFDDPMDFWSVSRVLCEDICEAFYSRNRFRVCNGSPRGFGPFLKLYPWIIWRLTSLTIRLDGEPPEAIELGSDWARLSQLEPIRLHTRYGRTALKDWEKVVRRLAECITRDRLNLYLIVHCPDLKTAEAVLKPLDTLPPLRGCGLCLHQEPQQEFIELIRRTVKNLTTMHVGTQRQPFRYLDLPLELRYRILEHSDLIYSGALEWKPQVRDLGPHFLSPRCSVHGETHVPHGALGRPLPRDCSDACFEGDSYSQQFTMKPLPDIHCCYKCKTPSGDDCPLPWNCSCVFTGSHSAYSSTCIDPTFLHPLFLVSHQVRQDALPVFFQRNSFVISSPEAPYIRLLNRGLIPLDHYNRPIILPRYELSLFLSMMPSVAICHLRRVEWLIPFLRGQRYDRLTAYFDYLDTIEMMARAMHLPQLTLILNLRTTTRDHRVEYFEWPRRFSKDGDTYDKLLRPLQRLRGLKDCFVYLKRITLRGYPDRYDNDEMRYEKAIMGEDYDSTSRGKPWKERVERMTDYAEDQVQAYANYESN